MFQPDISSAAGGLGAAVVARVEHRWGLLKHAHTTEQSDGVCACLPLFLHRGGSGTTVKSKQATDSLLRHHPTSSLSPQQSTFDVSRALAAVAQVLRGLIITGIITVIIRTVYFPSSCCCSGPAWTWLLPPHHHCRHHYHHNKSTFYCHHPHHNGLLSTVIIFTMV